MDDDLDEEDDRTTRELLETLNSDFLRCHQHVIRQLNVAERTEDGQILADAEFEARQLVRAAFAYIEGAIYVLKIEATFNADEKHIELSPNSNTSSSRQTSRSTTEGR